MPENCCIHAGLIVCAASGDDHGDTALGGENRSGGDNAKGTPR